MPSPLENNFKKALDANFELLKDIPTRKEFLSLTERVLQFVAKAKEELTARIEAKLAKVRDGKDGRDGVDGKTVKGPKGDKGDKGDRGPAGRTFIALRGEQGPAGVNAAPDTGDEIIRKINEDSQHLIIKEAVEGLPQLEEKVNSIELRPAGPGGAKGIGLYVNGAKKLLTAQTINLVAGTNVTLSYNSSNGRNDITISSTGDASGGLSVLPATGTVDDSNVTFTFASTPTLVVVNGTAYRNGFGVTIVTTTATLDNPPGTGGDVYGLG